MKKAEAARREQERLRKLAEARQDRAIVRANEKGLEAPTPIIPMATVDAPERTVRGDFGATTRKLVWKFEIEDEDVLSREWLMPNEKAIAGAVAGGIRNIRGVRIYQDVDVAVRS